MPYPFTSSRLPFAIATVIPGPAGSKSYSSVASSVKYSVVPESKVEPSTMSRPRMPRVAHNDVSHALMGICFEYIRPRGQKVSAGKGVVGTCRARTDASG